MRQNAAGSFGLLGPPVGGPRTGSAVRLGLAGPLRLGRASGPELIVLPVLVVLSGAAVALRLDTAGVYRP